jgi:hypothetical protein
MAKKKSYGKTKSGIAITEELVEKLAAEAERGYDLEETMRRRPGRPTIGSGPASVESVRLDPELRQALAQRAQRDHEATSSVIRKALREPDKSRQSSWLDTAAPKGQAASVRWSPSRPSVVSSPGPR